MGKLFLNGNEWTSMVLSGAEQLSANAERINALNVFPVPDGDTGTNMNLTMSAGTAELIHKPSSEVGKAADTLSRGLLMGARGNSGVILSQLFRGFARAVGSEGMLTVPLFAAALQQGVDTAYKAVVKPVEGTILTVAREAAKHGAVAARRTDDVTVWMTEVLAKAQETLARTTDMLPVLKQIGVVDSGGQGLVCIYEGFVDYLNGALAAGNTARQAPPPIETSAASPTGQRPQPTFGSGAGTPPAAPVRALAQSQIETSSIVFPYDMEFFIRLASARVPFPTAAFRKALERDGDSIILIEDGDIVKVHVHSRRPGDVLNQALAHGELTNVHILNMREQHRELLGAGRVPAVSSAPFAPSSPTARALAVSELDEGLGLEAASGFPALADEEPPAFATAAQAASGEPNPGAHELADYGVVAVSVGEGNAELFRSLGVDIVLSGGQSMNPSTEHLLGAVQSLAAHRVFLLPNNPNVIMAAKQAAELADRPVIVVPTRTIPQGMAAMLAFQEHDAEDVNIERMTKASEQVQTGQVTVAVRDTSMDGVDVREGHYIGIRDKTIVTCAPDKEQAARELLAAMLQGGEGGEIVTILKGEDTSVEEAERLADWLEEQYPEAEVEVHDGGQPLYPFLFAVEP